MNAACFSVIMAYNRVRCDSRAVVFAMSLSQEQTFMHISLFPLLLFVGELHASASVMGMKMMP